MCQILHGKFDGLVFNVLNYLKGEAENVDLCTAL
jgi:hypothetical protein